MTYYNSVKVGDKVRFVTLIGREVDCEVIKTELNEFGETEYCTIKVIDELQEYTNYEVGHTMRVATVYLRKM